MRAWLLGAALALSGCGGDEAAEADRDDIPPDATRPAPDLDVTDAMSDVTDGPLDGAIVDALPARDAGPIDGGPIDAGMPPSIADPDHPLLAPGPLVIAHRGGRRLAPENTIVAFRAAWEAGVDVLEVDLRGTADGHVVALHDHTVDRTTDGTGAIAELTLEEVRALDAGWRFRDGGVFPWRDMGVTVPTLEEVLAALPDAPLSIEIKQAEPPIVDAVVAALDAYDARRRVVVGSFADATVHAFRRAAPDVVTSLALAEIIAWITLPPGPDAPRWQPGGHILQIPTEQAGFVLVTDANIAHAHRHGLRVQPWTINDPDEMRRLLEMGVDGIITDDPLMLQAVLDDR